MSHPPLTARFLSAGDTALVVELGDTIDRAISDRVLALGSAVEAAALQGVVELVPTFRSLMIHYDPLRLDRETLERSIRPLLDRLGAVAGHGRLWRLPCCYGGEHGPDLDEVADRTDHTPAEVIAIHSASTYHIYALGFLPGYPYMGDVPEALSLPRRESPRMRVPMGSVCIALRMAGIYSLDSPGGWHLLGRTPVRLFDVRRKAAVLLSPGDQVQFEPVTAETYAQLEMQAADGRLAIAPAELAR
ncbi:MAG: 5-oxoprolinase subunit PxpB [Hyphomicrobiaceae bacterium]|nr:5-oxoprolinase subunit PxpB [Hyphomicrobiaceae bacterium]